MTGARSDRGILILGHPRSGTTLLRRLLNGHPEIASPPETHLMSACARFLESDLTADGVDMGVLAGLDFAGFGDDDVLAGLRQFAFGFLEDFARRQGKARWAEKTAFDIFHLDAIERLCQGEVHYVGIIRHPFDVAVSCLDFCNAAGVYPAPMHAYIRRHAQPVEAFLHGWLETTTALLALAERQAENCIVCRYEDLVAHPDETMADILSAVGASPAADGWNGALQDDGTMGFSDHKSYQADSVHGDSVARWSALPQPQIARLAPLVADTMELCGYQPVDAGAPLDAAAARHRYATSLAVHAARRAERPQGK